ncbi:MAG: DNA-processing protein DprA [Streptosporangiaceae bacterium]
MSTQPGDSRAARATLTYLAEPADPLLGTLLRETDPCEIVAAIRSGAVPTAMSRRLNPAQQAGIRPSLARWRTRLAVIPAGTGLGFLEARGVHLLCPGDPGWPGQLDDLGLARPYALWVRGETDLRDLCRQSVAVVGSRAATAYGRHMCAEICGGLSTSGWVIISGGAYGIDVTAHRAALACGGSTVAVLACGPDLAYPREHAGLLDDIATHGAVVSEYPPGTLPARHRFLARNRVIAALARGTLVVEAAQRSGTMVTALRASELGRPVMAVPGPVTSAMSAGCHVLIRAGEAVLVTDAAEAASSLPTGLAGDDGVQSG